nr:immunoglobulin heavy chain junction region [Macaca mulatta]
CARYCSGIYCDAISMDVW